MAHVIEFEDAKGKITLIEVEGQPVSSQASGPIKASGGAGAGTAVKARVRFEEALTAIKPSVDAFCTVLNDLAKKPEEVELSFGLKITAGLDLFTVAKTSGEANYNLKLKWKP